MTWKAKIVYKPDWSPPVTWRCEHKHNLRDRAVRCGTVKLRRITAGHNVAPVTLDVEGGPS